MRLYLRVSKGWEKLRTWLHIIYPSSQLKLFPPHFIMRDAVMEHVEKAIKAGSQCALLLLDIKQYAEMKNLYPSHVLLHMEETVAEAFRSVAKKHFSEEELLVVQKYYDDDYVMIIKAEGADQAGLEQKAGLFRQDLEREIAIRTGAFFDFPIQFHSALTIVRTKAGSVQEALLSAWQDARAIARKHYPADVGHVRAEIREIIEEENIKVLAQPIFSLSTGKIFGWEILTRGPEHTPYYKPLELFNFAYQAKLLVQLELLVFKKSFLVMSKKTAQLPVFINVSVPSLSNPYFFAEVKKLLAQFPEINPNQIVLEITERHVIEDFAAFHQAISAFRQAGFKFAVDDLGAGYASLHMISELLPDVIKVDRSIIHQIDSHEIKDSVLQALLLVARKIGSRVVAEGIETEAEAKALLKKNVDFAQGFFFAPPEEPFPAAGENWLEKHALKL
jgi:EAL domain-containing protein (putative c-di-GMP-specific phosphodiesterase class I)